MSRIWILGAPDPEMEAIEGLLRECGETVVYAADARGERVTAGAAYRGESLVTDVGNHPCTSGVTTVYLVECELLPPDVSGAPGEDICHPELAGRTVRRIDHHRPGDPGYGRPPSGFLAASSIGQVIRELARLVWLPGWETIAGPPWEPGTWELTTVDHDGRVWRSDPGIYDTGSGEWDWAVSFATGCWLLVPRNLILCAAADHCLGAAYRGECPGVDPDALMRWRAESRARFRGRAVGEVLSDMQLAREAIARAPKLEIAGRPIADLRAAYTVSTVLVAPFVEGANVDASGVGDSEYIEFGELTEGAWDEGGHHTFVRRGVPELPDAASREGVAYLAYVDRDGSGRRCRPKVVLGGCTTPEMVRAFLDHWAPAQGLVDAYGDPQRGFAGAYLTTEALQ
jgi:hypothetical protein